jgi:two-component system phosphate regulon sensor histidine kinase PhoR
MRGSLFLRTFLGYLVLAVALSGVILLFSLDMIRDHYTDTLAADLEKLAAAVGMEVAPLAGDQRFEELQSLVTSLGRRTSTRITLVDSSGRVIADSEDDPTHMDNHLTRPEVAGALQGGPARATRLSATTGEEMLYVALPMEADGGTVGVVRVSSYMEQVDRLVSALRNRIVRLAGVVVVLSLVAALLISRGLTRQISELVAASQKVAGGDFEVKVLLKGSGEVKQLGDSFNHMTERIRELVGETTRRQQELVGVLSSISDGLVVLSADGTITLSNQAFRRIAGHAAGEAAIEGRPYWEVLKAPEFADLVRSVVEDRTTGAPAGGGRAGEAKSGRTGEVPTGGKTYLCSVALVGESSETVALFHDISEAKAVERMKRDFILNLSHELRTPLTAIKGFLETLGDQPDEKTAHYLEIIRRHTDRLVAIVEDLLKLSQLEDPLAKLDVRVFDLRGMLEDVVALFDDKARQKNLSITLEAPAGACDVRADAFRLEQVFVNLVDNAIKYTEQGGITVSLDPASCEGGSAITVAVSDTGIGIDQEHLDRVFERFYVVDKSRSKKSGGTGLGLAIVKHIVLAHGGSVDVESTPGKGTSFNVTLPVSED